MLNLQAYMISVCDFISHPVLDSCLIVLLDSWVSGQYYWIVLLVLVY